MPAGVIADKVTAFTGAMRREFLLAYDAARPVTPAPYEAFTLKVPSENRVEEYPWKSPPPRLSPYIGERRYANVDLEKYRVTNQVFDAAFAVSLRDIRDEKINAYKSHPQQMAADAVNFPGREVLKKLALGTTDACFDGGAFFANSHAIGTGDNLMTRTLSSGEYDTGDNDGSTHVIIALIHDGPVKPMLWQDRMTADSYGVQTDGNTPQSLEAEKVKYWTQAEGAAGYGFWWDAIHYTVTHIPNETGAQKILRDLTNQFKTFYLEKAESGEDRQYPHEQKVLSTANCTLVVEPDIYDVFDLVLNSETIVRSGAAVTNRYRGRANLIASAYVAD